ncbi:hypothetical protein [Novosphingobium sp. KA1]|uniref:hypothetical protein n=1 Tax=Novosphingobium sp. (strain KA1) TaxID=164608 RepID=UPI001A8D68D9|nr:hypothetical protein [Novosphingobium sp. KA1]
MPAWIVALERFTGANAAMLLIDHQVGTMKWVSSLPVEEMKRNALMLAKTARILHARGAHLEHGGIRAGALLPALQGGANGGYRDLEEFAHAA